MKTNLAVFFGGRSVEHEVSIISAVQAMNALDREKYNVIPIYITKDAEMYTGPMLFFIENYRNMQYLLGTSSPVSIVRNGQNVVMKYLKTGFLSRRKDVILDVAFPIVHGTNCEDGALSGFLELLGLPYVGCDIISAAVGMDKAIYKDVLKNADLPVLPCYKFTSREYTLGHDEIVEKIIAEFGLPVIIKPVNLGSSVGISKADTKEELIEAIDLAVKFSDLVLAERAVENLREINCSVLGDRDECEASVLEEPVMHDKILSYKDKYEGDGKTKGMASLSRKIPAELDEATTQKIRTLSCEIFKALGCCGVVRIDYLMDEKTGEVFANEINTIPGSLSFYLWDATGIKYPELLDRLIQLAFKRQRNRDNLTFTIPTNILSGVSFGKMGAKGTKGSKF